MVYVQSNSYRFCHNVLVFPHLVCDTFDITFCLCCAPGLSPSGWADGWLSWDFELLCGDGRREPLSEWENCNLGAIPPNIIMTRPVLTSRVYDFLMKSQVRLKSQTNRNLNQPNYSGDIVLISYNCFFF